MAIGLGGLIAQSIGSAGTIMLPLVGAVRGWQAAFLIVGMASLLLVPMLCTLREPERRSFGAIEVTGEALGAFFRRRAGLVACYFGALAALTLMAYANVAWFPSYFIRVHGLGQAEVGARYGATLAFAGTLGLVIGGLLSDWLVARGWATGHLMLAAGASALAIVPGVMTPLADSADSAFMLMIPLVFFGGMPTGAAATMTQLIAPSHLRGMVVAVFLLWINLVGIGIGPLSIGLLNDHLFHDPLAIGRSMAIVIGCASTIGAIMLLLALRPYARALKEIDAARS